jgi:hypothetical protein
MDRRLSTACLRLQSARARTLRLGGQGSGAWRWRRGLSPLPAAALGYDKPLYASLAGFTLHAATRAGSLDPEGRERLLRYVLRPPVAYGRIEHRPAGLVRIALKRAFGDRTVAVELDPLSLLCRRATSVPPPRFHTVKYAGVLAPASAWRARARPQPEPIAQVVEPINVKPSSDRRSCYRGWAELLKRTFEIDVLQCPSCSGRMKLIALVTEPKSIVGYLTKLCEPIDVPARGASRGPPYWKSTVLRRKVGA